MGKILVILNLLFALVTGGFLVVDFATRNNWKKAYENLKDEVAVARSNYQTLVATAATADKREKDAARVLEDAKKELKEKNDLLQAQQEVFKIKLEEEKNRTKDSDVKHQQAVTEAERLKQEILDLSETVKNRNKYILDIQETSRKYLNEAKGNENKARSTQERNEALLAEIERLNRKIAEVEAGAYAPKTIRDLNRLNPPPVYVKGIIEQVDAKDRLLVQVSLGTDQGVNKYHTLEVYRTSPQPEYLGTIRIEEAFHHKSIGRLMRPSLAASRTGLKAGDQVASSLTNR